MISATPIFSSATGQATGMIIIAFPLATLLTTWILRRLIHRLTLLWVRFTCYRKVNRHYNPDATFTIEAPTCTALLSADEIAAQLCTPTDYLRWLNPQQALQKMTAVHTLYCEETVDALMDSTHPSLWAALPHTLRQQCYRHAQRYLTPFLDDVIDDLIEQADELFDFRETIRAQLKQQQFDQAANFLLCLKENSESLLKQREKAALAISALIPLLLVIFAPTLSTGLLEASNGMRFGIILSLSSASLLLTSLLPASWWQCVKKAPQAPTQHAQTAQNHTTAPLPESFEQPARALGKILAESLLDIPSQIASLKSPPKRSTLEKVVSHRFQQWFIDTLPTPGLRHRFARKEYTTLLCEEASFQCIQAMDRPFDDPDFITYCTIRVEQALYERLRKLSGHQFSALLGDAQMNYRTGWLLLLLGMIASSLLGVWLLG